VKCYQPPSCPFSNYNAAAGKSTSEIDENFIFVNERIKIAGRKQIDYNQACEKA
jgi:hypothetical protein